MFITNLFAFQLRSLRPPWLMVGQGKSINWACHSHHWVNKVRMRETVAHYNDGVTIYRVKSLFLGWRPCTALQNLLLHESYLSKQAMKTNSENMAAAPTSSSASLGDKLEKRKGVKYHPPKFNYRMSRHQLKTGLTKCDRDYWISCAENKCKNPWNGSNIRKVWKFHTYVLPVIHKKLNPVCTENTRTMQEMVDDKPTLGNLFVTRKVALVRWLLAITLVLKHEQNTCTLYGMSREISESSLPFIST